MESFANPFFYFVSLSWRFFGVAMILYITVYFLSCWKDFLQLHR